MSITRALGAALAVTFALGTAASLAAQTTYPSVKVKGRLQVQAYDYNHSTFASAGDSGVSNIFVRRARIEVEGDINEYVKVKIQPSFEGGRAPSTSTCTSGKLRPDSTVAITCTNGNGSIRLRDAYIDVSFMKESAKTRFGIRMGQEKRPFSRYELTSSNNLPSIERGAGRGLPGKASNDIFTDNGFVSHDVGAAAIMTSKLSDKRTLYLQAGVYNGEGESLNDKNMRKSFGIRGTIDVYSKLNVGGSYFSHDNARIAAGKDSSYSNTAWGVDGQWGKPGDAGLYAMAEYLAGKDKSVAANDIRGYQVVAAYNIRLKSPTSWLYAVEPAFRFDESDPNTILSGSQITTANSAFARITTWTAVLGFYMSSKAQFRIAYENQTSELDNTVTLSGVRTALTVNF